MNESKICPYCGEIIKETPVKCRFCGEWLNKEMAHLLSSNNFTFIKMALSNRYDIIEVVGREKYPLFIE